MEKTKTKRYVLLAILLSLALCVGGGLLFTIRAQAADVVQIPADKVKVGASLSGVPWSGQHSIQLDGDFSAVEDGHTGAHNNGSPEYNAVAEKVLINGVLAKTVFGTSYSAWITYNATTNGYYQYTFFSWVPETGTVLTVLSGLPVYNGRSNVLSSVNKIAETTGAVRYVYNGTAWEKGEVNATDITFAATQQALGVGEELNLGAAFSPVGTLGETITYESSDSTKATVDATGKVTGVAPGTVTITAKSGTIEKEYSLTVTAEYSVTGLKITANGAQSVYTGSNASYALPTVVEVRDLGGGNTSEVPLTITADNIAIKAGTTAFDKNTPGTYTYTVTVNDSKETERTVDFTMEVKAVPEPTMDNSTQYGGWGSQPTIHFGVTNSSNVTGTSGNASNGAGGRGIQDNVSKVLYNGVPYAGTFGLTCTDTSYNFVLYGVNSKEGDIVTVQSGMTMYLTNAATENLLFAVSQKAYAFIYTNNAWQMVGDPESITFAATAKQIGIGEELQLGASYLPAGALGEVITYETSDATKATVDATGKVTGVAAGAVTITAKGNGFTADYTLTVMADYTVKSISITAGGTQSIYTGVDYILPTVAEVRDYDGTESTTAISITADNVAAKAGTTAYNKNVPGTYTFTVTVTDSKGGTQTADFTVEVKALPKPTADFASKSWGNNHTTVHFAVNNTSNLDGHSGGFTETARTDKLLYNGATYTTTPVSIAFNVSATSYGIVFFNLQKPNEKDVITVKAGTALYENKTTQAVFAVTQEDYRFVYIGGQWVEATAATGIGFTATAHTVLKTDAAFNLGAKFTPENGIGGTDTYGTFTYTSSQPAVATVDASGLVTPVAAGNTVITVTCGTLTQTYNLEVAEQAEKTKLNIAAGGAQTIDPYGTYELPQLFWTLKVGDVTTDGATFTADKADVSEGNFDPTKAGTYTLTVTMETDKHVQFTVTVKAFTELTWKDELDKADAEHSHGDMYLHVDHKFECVDTGTDGFCNDVQKVKIYRGGEKLVHASHVRVGLNTVQFYFLNMNGNTRAYDPISDPLEGDRLVIEKGFGFTVPEGAKPATGADNRPMVTYASKGFIYIYISGVWVKYTAEPTAIAIQKPEGVTDTIYTNIPVQLTPVFTAEGTSGTVVWTSSNTSLATVDENGRVMAVGTGTVEITATCVTQEQTPKTLTAKVTFTVKDSGQLVGVNIVNPYSIHVAKGETITELPSKWYARPIYEPTAGEKMEGNEFELVLGENLILPTTQPTDTVGKTQWDVTVKVAYGSGTVDQTGKLSVTVYEYYDQEISAIAVLDPATWAGWDWHMLVALGNTSTNEQNIVSADFAPIKEKILYKRADGTDIEFSVFGVLGGHIGLRPAFWNDPDISLGTLGNYYREGDVLTFKQGMPMYKQVVKDGQVIIEGYLKEDTVYIYKNAMWNFFKDYTGVAAAKPALTVAIGKSIPSGVSKVPVNASEGLITYSSSDTGIATVTASGLVRGVAAGEATITATITDLNDPDREAMSVTVTVTVVDEITGIVFEPESITVAPGAEVSLSGVKAYYKWASGKKGDEVDLGTATVTGFDPEKAEEQSVTVKVTVDGTTYSGKLKVTVGETQKKGCGCKSSMEAGASVALAGLMLTLGAVLVVKKKKA